MGTQATSQSEIHSLETADGIEVQLRSLHSQQLLKQYQASTADVLLQLSQRAVINQETIRLETLLLFTLGMTGEDFVALKTKVMMNKINNIIDLQAQKDIDNAYQRLKLLATHETSYAIQLACNGLLNGRSNKHPLICPCGTIINDQHLTTC